MTEKKRKMLATVSATAIVAAWAAFLVVLFVSDNVEIDSKREHQGFIELQADRAAEQYDADTPLGTATDYQFLIPATLDRDAYLAFYTVHQYVQVYLDGANIYSLMPSSELSFMKTTGSNWNMIPIYREDAGKELRVTIIPVYENVRNRQVAFLLGSELAIYTDRLSQDIVVLLFSGITVFVGFVFCLIAAYSLLTDKSGGSLLALGIFAILLGCCRFTDTRFSPFLCVEKPVLLFYISIVAMMYGIIALIKAQQDWLRVTIADGYCIVVSVCYMVLLVLQLCGILDLREMLWLVHGFIFVGIMLLSADRITKRKSDKEDGASKSKQVILWILAFGIFLDAAIYYTQRTSSGLLFTLLAFLCYVIYMGLQFIFRYVKQEKVLVEQQQQILQGRIIAMMSQIRSHFIFNVLNAISGMCKYDPEKADRTIVYFARYLRNNIDILEDDSPVPFSVALRHLEDYIALEQVRFGDKIEFVTDITVEQFTMPSLILQPIVENAIKHGLLPKPSGGIITLHTWENEDSIQISIQDDGVGFDRKALEKKETVGLNNVRARLQYIMQGSLEIESNPGCGTTVTISIPKEESQTCV